MRTALDLDVFWTEGQPRGWLTEHVWSFKDLEDRCTSALVGIDAPETRREIIVKWRTLDAFSTISFPQEVRDAFEAMLMAREIKAAYAYAHSILNRAPHLGKWP